MKLFRILLITLWSVFVGSPALANCGRAYRNSNSRLESIRQTVDTYLSTNGGPFVPCSPLTGRGDDVINCGGRRIAWSAGWWNYLYDNNGIEFRTQEASGGQSYSDCINGNGIAIEKQTSIKAMSVGDTKFYGKTVTSIYYRVLTPQF